MQMASEIVELSLSDIIFGLIYSFLCLRLRSKKKGKRKSNFSCHAKKKKKIE